MTRFELLELIYHLAGVPRPVCPTPPKNLPTLRDIISMAFLLQELGWEYDLDFSLSKGTLNVPLWGMPEATVKRLRNLVEECEDVGLIAGAGRKMLLNPRLYLTPVGLRHVDNLVRAKCVRLRRGLRPDLKNPDTRVYFSRRRAYETWEYAGLVSNFASFVIYSVIWMGCKSVREAIFVRGGFRMSPVAALQRDGGYDHPVLILHTLAKITNDTEILTKLRRRYK